MFLYTQIIAAGHDLPGAPAKTLVLKDFPLSERSLRKLIDQKVKP